MGKRYAVVVGCNYPRTKMELRGAPLNASNISVLLHQRFGFNYDNMKVLCDVAPDTTLPTINNIRAAINNMVNHCRPGDLLFFYFSGHGGRKLAARGHTEEEYILTTDNHHITNHDFRGWVNQLPPRVSFTVVSESCHSGGLIDKEKEQITGRTHSKGNDSRAISPDNGILLSACRPDETAIEVRRDPSSAHGAFTNALEAVLRKNHNITNRELVMRTSQMLHNQGFKQHPCLYCNDSDAHKLFLQ